MPDIFLSYNREDQATARRFAEAFEREGFSVWWDATLRSGEAYDEVTETALRTAKAVVVLWSKKSVVSRWVRAEATLANRNKTLVPATIEPCDRPIMFELTQTADLSHWDGDANDPAWRAYLADVRRLVERKAPRSSPAQPSATRASGPDVPTVPERGGEPNLVVLRITNRSGLPEDEAFAEDLTSEIVAELTRHGWAKVITPVAINDPQGAGVDPRALARELDARYLMQAHLRRVGTSLRLMVELLEAGAGRIVWTQKYDRPLADLAALEEALAVEVASHVGEQQILRLEVARAMQKSSGWSAWERALRSLACAGRMSPESMRVAAEEALQALALAPDYALAHALVAWARALGAHWFGSEASADEVRWHIKRAIDLDSTDSRVFRQVAWSSTAIGDAQAGLRFAERAVELAPHVAAAHGSLAHAYQGLGRNAEAIAEFDIQQALTPHDFARYASHLTRAVALFSESRLAEAREALDRSLKLNPNFVIAQKWKAIVSALLGQADEARRAVRDMRATEPSLSLEDHAAQIWRMLPDRARAAEADAALRTIWAEVERAA